MTDDIIDSRLSALLRRKADLLGKERKAAGFKGWDLADAALIEAMSIAGGTAKQVRRRLLTLVDEALQWPKWRRRREVTTTDDDDDRVFPTWDAFVKASMAVGKASAAVALAQLDMNVGEAFLREAGELEDELFLHRPPAIAAEGEGEDPAELARIVAALVRIKEQAEVLREAVGVMAFG